MVTGRAPAPVFISRQIARKCGYPCGYQSFTLLVIQRLVSQYRRCQRAEELKAANARHARRSLESFDGAIVPLLEDTDGEILSIGRKTRSIPSAIRRALRARDRGCRFPGCINHYRLDGHHIKHWADGGDSRLDNLLQLCRHHHRLLHEGGFSCERQTGGKIVLRDPYGRVIADGHVPETAIATMDETGWFEEYLADVDIDADTCVSRWQGERIDWPLAVGHLFH